MKQHAAFLEGFPQRGHMQPARGGGIESRLAQGLLHGRCGLVQLSGLEQAILPVELAARKDIGAAEHARLAVALEQQHLQPLRPVAKQHDRGGVDRRRQHFVLIDLEVHLTIVALARRTSGQRAGLFVAFATVGTGGQGICIT